MNKAVVICGPTSTGKTSLALRLCKAFNGEIISADSRQVYKYMDIGTGKLPVDKSFSQIEKYDGFWKVIGTPIYMYDVVSPAKSYSVYNYSKKAQNELLSIQERQKFPFIVGGTGFYIDVLTGKKPISNIPPNIKLREELNKKSLEELQSILRKTNENKYALIDINNKARLIRAVEISQSKGVQNTEKDKNCSLDILSIGLTAPRKFLYGKADWWVEKIVEKGIILETKNLLDYGFRETAPMKGMVYSSAVDYLDEKIPLSDMKQKVKWDIHGYIRRQLTWFGRNAKIRWFNIAEKGFDIEVLKTVQSFLDGGKKIL